MLDSSLLAVCSVPGIVLDDEGTMVNHNTVPALNEPATWEGEQMIIKLSQTQYLTASVTRKDTTSVHHKGLLQSWLMRNGFLEEVTWKLRAEGWSRSYLGTR